MSGAFNDRSVHFVGVVVVWFTTHIHIAPTLGMCGAIPLHFLFAFISWTESAIPFFSPFFARLKAVLMTVCLCTVSTQVSNYARCSLSTLMYIYPNLTDCRAVKIYTHPYHLYSVIPKNADRTRFASAFAYFIRFYFACWFSCQLSSSCLLRMMDHYNVQTQTEQRRKFYGCSWLHPQAEQRS
jgi:hypothetical protein